MTLSDMGSFSLDESSMEKVMDYTTLDGLVLSSDLGCSDGLSTSGFLSKQGRSTHGNLVVKMEGKLNVLTGQNGVEVCRRIDFQPCGTGNRVGLLSGNSMRIKPNLL